MRILGIDPGSVATGFGVVERVEGNLHHLAHGTLKPPRLGQMAERLAFLHTALCDVIDAHRPEIAVVEQVFVARNPRSAVILGQARGVALAALGAARVPVQEYSAREVKQAVVGTGSAAKSQVQLMVARLLELARSPQADAADALAVAICHANAGPLRELGMRAPGRRRSLRDVARQLT
jgi:crossover junction endodeoxyribonuclease RuvC